MTVDFFSGRGRERFRAGGRWLALLFAVGTLRGGAAVAFAESAPEIAPAPVRLVSLAPAITETLFRLGLGSRVVGVSTYCDYPEQARALPKVGTFSEPVAEAIVALHPDLVLTSPSPGNEATVRAIERSGVKVAVVQGEGGLAEVRAAIREIARAAGAEAAGDQVVADMDERLAAIKAAAAALEQVPVAVVVGREPLVLAGPGSYLGELLALAGGDNVADKVGGRWPRVGLEFLVTASPQVIIDLSVAMGEIPGGEGLSAFWSDVASVPAVATGRVVGDRASVMLRPGPRLAEAAESLFVALHPGTPLPGHRDAAK